MIALDHANRMRAVFFLHAIASGGLYSRISQIQQGLGADEFTLGLAFFGFPLGSILVVLFGSRLIEAAGTKPVIVFSITGLAAATAALVAMPTVPLFFAAFVLYALFYTLPNIAMNIEADRIEAAGARRVMNSCHGVWSAGYLLATLIGTAAVSLGLSPVMHMTLLAIPIVPVALFVTLGIEPAAPRPHTAQAIKRLSLPTAAILLLVAFMIGPNLLEGSLRNWSVIYMRESFGAPGWVDTLTLPVFLLAQSLGRLSADGMVTRFGPVRVARGLNVAAFAGCAMVLLAPNLYVALLGFLLVGVGVCVSYPLTTSAAARIGDRPSSQNVASLTLSVQIILLASPTAMGWVAENWGLRAIYAIILPTVVASHFLARYLAPKPAAA